MKKIGLDKDTTIAVFIIAFIAIGNYYFFIHTPKESPTLPSTKCPIEYGYLTCIDEKPRIPFFNPNEVDLTNIQVIVPKKDGEDIYQITEALKPKDTQVLTLLYHDCSATPRGDELQIKWCCSDSNDCYGFYMTAPSDALTVSDINETTSS